jgi:glutathione S-transferase
MIVRERFGKADAAPNEALLAEARKRLKASVAVIDRALEGRAFICGANFTAADIMVSYGIVMARIIRELPAELANVAGYLERLKQRPGYDKAWG